MKISLKELLRIAKLAKLELTEEERGVFCEQISDILTFISELKEVDISRTDVIGQINDEINNWRSDTVKDCPKEVKSALLESAPEKEGNFFKVPGVFEDQS